VSGSVHYDTIPPTLQVSVGLHRVPGGGDGGVEDEEQCAGAGPYSQQGDVGSPAGSY